MNAVILLEQRGCLKGRQRLAATGRVPDVSVAAVVVDALHNLLHGIDLIRPHDHQLLLAGHEDHVAADGLSEVAFSKESFREGVEVGDLLVVLVRELIDGQESFVGIKSKMPSVVVGKVVGVVTVADDEELHKAEQRLVVTVAGVVLVFDDLFHGPPRADAEGLQLDLHNRHAVDEQNNIVTVMAVVRVDAKLVDDFKCVLAPVLDVDQRVVQWSAVVACERVAIAQGACGREDIGGDDFVQQAGELRVCQADVVQSFELFAKVLLQGSSVANVRTVFVLQSAKLLDELIFKMAFGCCH